MTREEINILQEIVDIYEKEDMYPLLQDKQISTIKMAIQALEQIDKIKQIIAIDNSVIQEDVMKYKMICEVVEE